VAYFDVLPVFPGREWGNLLETQKSNFLVEIWSL